MYVDGWRDALREVGRQIGAISASSVQSQGLQASALGIIAGLMLQPGAGRQIDFNGSRRDLSRPPEDLDVQTGDCDRQLRHAGHYWQDILRKDPPYYCRGVGLQTREDARLLDLTAYRARMGREPVPNGRSGDATPFQGPGTG